MKIFMISALCLAMSSPALAATEQFDLTCSTDEQKDALHIRVDLTANEWCSNKCEDIERIHEVSSGKITFKDKGDKSNKIAREFMEVNRMTGVLEKAYDDFMYFRFSSKFQCTPLEFSGMRRNAAKF